MAAAHEDAGAAAEDVVELQGAVTVDEVKDVGGVHGGAGKLATAADVEKEEGDGWGKKRKLAFTGFDPYDPDYSDDEEYEYDSGEDVYKGNFKSFKAKEVENIKAKGVASFFNLKIKKWRCPYCTTKAKPKDGRFDHLVSHAENVAIRGEDYMIRGQHAARH
ncbi:lrr receptor-like serine threonine-protein kinase [Hordeum vulgare]|nr:lrr receptor-like serine threonine-protein kinase [Hordeum vulgare]